MKDLPRNVKAYKRTDVFDEKNIPTGLLKDHLVADDVWAKIVVLKGNLTYVIQGEHPEEVKLGLLKHGVVEPGVYHHVIAHEGVEFYVEFYK